MAEPLRQREPPRPYEELVEAMYAHLRRVADDRVRRVGARPTFDATDLVHDCWLKLHAAPEYGDLSRDEFLALSSRIIRNVLVDKARQRNAKKRGGDRHRLSLHEDLVVGGGPEVDLLDLDDALARLEGLDPDQARIVELRFFGGLTNEEVAQTLGVTRHRVSDEWAMARAWLQRELSR